MNRHRPRGSGAATFPRSMLRPTILVLLHEEPDHGYALRERVVDLGLGHLDSAGLYRGLRALEEEGAVRSWWMSAERGAPRRVYALTEKGDHELAQALVGLARQRDAMAGLVERGRDHPSPRGPGRQDPTGKGAAWQLQAV